MNKQKRLAQKVKKLGFCFVRPTGVRTDSQKTACSHSSWAKNQSSVGRRVPDVLSRGWIKGETAQKVASVLLTSHHFPLCLERDTAAEEEKRCTTQKVVTHNNFSTDVKQNTGSYHMVYIKKTSKFLDKQNSNQLSNCLCCPRNL